VLSPSSTYLLTYSRLTNSSTLFRDYHLVFTFKMMMAPTSESLPELRRWMPTDAALTWAYKPGKVAAAAAANGAAGPPLPGQPAADPMAGAGSFVVQGFGRQLEGGFVSADQEEVLPTSESAAAAAAAEPSTTLNDAGGGKVAVGGVVQSITLDESTDGVEAEKQKTVRKARSGFFSKFSNFFAGKGKPRAPPSGGDPSNLVGQRVDDEEDLLHIRHLPSFDGRLKARDCELLLSYLTVPYLRIPLLLQFFSDPLRVTALHSGELQVRARTD